MTRKWKELRVNVLLTGGLAFRRSANACRVSPCLQLEKFAQPAVFKMVALGKGTKCTTVQLQDGRLLGPC
jgi:hypothetical protein